MCQVCIIRDHRVFRGLFSYVVVAQARSNLKLLMKCHKTIYQYKYEIIIS